MIWDEQRRLTPTSTQGATRGASGQKSAHGGGAAQKNHTFHKDATISANRSEFALVQSRKGLWAVMVTTASWGAVLPSDLYKEVVSVLGRLLFEPAGIIKVWGCQGVDERQCCDTDFDGEEANVFRQ